MHFQRKHLNTPFQKGICEQMHANNDRSSKWNHLNKEQQVHLMKETLEKIETSIEPSPTFKRSNIQFVVRIFFTLTAIL